MYDLHLHLDGSLSLRCVKKIMKEKGLVIPKDDELLTSLTYNATSGTLTDYLKCFDMPISLMQDPESVRFTVMSLLEDLKSEGTRYAEIRFAPQFHTNNGYSEEDILNGALEGLRYGSLLGVNAKLILCLMRGCSEEGNEQTLELAKKYIGAGVCAIDLAGDESKYPVTDYAEYFKYARANNIPFTIHAGEAAGAESVENAVKLGARRIGHGLRAIDDLELVKYIAKEGIVLEMCPTSNIQTGAVKSIEEYPLVRFLEAGVCATINTDNRMVSNTNLRKEYQLIKQVPGYEEGMDKLLINNSKLAKF